MGSRQILWAINPHPGDATYKAGQAGAGFWDHQITAGMTVCVAALAGGSKQVVVAADRQITAGPVQFEHHERKIDELTRTSVVLSSGSALIAENVIGRTRKVLGAARDVEFSVIAERLRDDYMAVHIERADEVFYRPRGWTLAEFKQFGSTQIPVQVYLQIDQQVFNFFLETEFIVAGVDNAGGHIAWVHYHGINGHGWLETFDKIGYCAIGSGGIHASISLHLAGQYRDLSLARTIYNVYKAKKISEIAPGVGSQTDLAIVDSGGIKYLSEHEMDELGKIHKDFTTKEIPEKDLSPIEAFFKEQKK